MAARHWFTLGRFDEPATGDPAPALPTPPAPPSPPPAGDPPAPPKGDEPLGDAGKRALDAERAARKTADDARKALEAQLADLKPLADLMQKIRGGEGVPDAQKTEVEKLAERLDAAERTATEERLARLRLEVATEKGLTTAQAARIVGGDRDELAADADALLSLFPKPPPTVPPAGDHGNGGPRPPRPDPGQGGGRGDGQPKNYRDAPAEEFTAELGKYGIRPRSR